MSNWHDAVGITEQVGTLETRAASAALLRLDEALQMFDISTSIDKDNGLAVYLHTDAISAWVRREYFYIERVDNDGNPMRHITVHISRLQDAARLVATYDGCPGVVGGET